jgi:hypothetical protein
MAHVFSKVLMGSSLGGYLISSIGPNIRASRSRSDSTVFAECIVYRIFGVRAIACIAHREFHETVPAFTYERIECTAPLTGLDSQHEMLIAKLHIHTQFQFQKGLSDALAFRIVRLCGRCLIHQAH